LKKSIRSKKERRPLLLPKFPKLPTVQKFFSWK